MSSDGSRTTETLSTKPSFIDVHVHLDKLKTPFEDALTVAKDLGVDQVITIGTEPADHPVVLALSQKYFPRVACTLGVHPHEASLWNQGVGEWIRAAYQGPGARGIVAVGEIGLDYYYNNCPREVQLQAFREQMDLALELGLPVEIHTRDADADCAVVLEEYRGRVQGLLHCFTSSMELAKSALDCGFDISISGVVTFKNAEQLREIVRFIPVDRIHVETDAPFLAPVPMRGRSNLPEFVLHTAAAVADLKGVSLIDLSLATKANAYRLFPRLRPDGHSAN